MAVAALPDCPAQGQSLSFTWWLTGTQEFVGYTSQSPGAVGPPQGGWGAS